MAGIEAEEMYYALDTIWILISGSVIFLMACGFAMLEAGSMRSGNVSLILLKNLLDKASTLIAWWGIGYGLAFGEGDNGFVAEKVTEFHSEALKIVSQNAYGGFVIEYREIFFQWCVCFAASTIAGGALGERLNIKGYMVYSFFNAIFIYPIVAHWAWNPNGWLAKGFFDETYLDLAGCGVVHMVGGVAAVVGVIIIGPRKSSCANEQMGNHNVPLVVLGTMILWMGWFYFNAGSVRITSLWHIGIVAQICLNNTLSACGAALSTMLISSYQNEGKICIVAICNGILGGLVSITAACGNVDPLPALIIGFLGGLIYYFFAKLEGFMEWDDAVEAGAVHGACGFWGLVAAGLFARERGLFTFGSIELLGVQVVGGLVIFVWVAFWAFLCFKALDMVGMLRLCDTTESISKGHDLFVVGFPTYDFSQVCRAQGCGGESADDEQGNNVKVSNVVCNSEQEGPQKFMGDS